MWVKNTFKVFFIISNGHWRHLRKQNVVKSWHVFELCLSCALVRCTVFFRLLTTDLTQLKDDLPGDLQSLSWLTSVDVPRLQQIQGRRPEFNSSAQNSLLDQQTGQKLYIQCEKENKKCIFTKNGALLY